MLKCTYADRQAFYACEECAASDREPRMSLSILCVRVAAVFFPIVHTVWEGGIDSIGQRGSLSSYLNAGVGLEARYNPLAMLIYY